MNKKYLIGLAVIIALPLIYGFTAKYVESGNEELLNKDQVMVTGEQLFQKNCSACHRIDMTGNPPVFPSLVKVNERMKKNEVMELLQTGRNVMPSFAHITKAERLAIAGYLFGETTETEMVTDITPTENGNSLFVANCARCHKTNPGDPQPPDQKEWGMQPAILGGITDRYKPEEFGRILNSGPCYMPSFETLETTDKNDIYAYLETFEREVVTNSRENGMGCQMRCRNMK